MSQISTLELWKEHEDLKAGCSANGVLQQMGHLSWFLASRSTRGRLSRQDAQCCAPGNKDSRFQGTEPVTMTEACLFLQGLSTVPRLKSPRAQSFFPHAQIPIPGPTQCPVWLQGLHTWCPSIHVCTPGPKVWLSWACRDGA